MAETGYVDFRQIRTAAASLASQAVHDAFGPRRDANTALEGVKAANVAAQGTTEAVVASVTAARGAGASWTDIGRALGVTKQGARQRFAELSEEDPLIYGIYATRQAGEVIQVPKPWAIVLPAFAWIREGIDGGKYGEASTYVDGREAFIKVDRIDFVKNHPSVTESLLVTDEFRDPSSCGRVLLARRSVQPPELVADLEVGDWVLANGERCRVHGFTESDIQLLPERRDFPADT